MLTLMKAKAKLKARMATRAAVLQDTAERFFRVAETLGENMSWYNSQLETMLSERLVSGFHIVLCDGTTPISGASLLIDWEQHKFLCSLQEEIEVPGEDADQTFPSVSEALRAIETFLKGVSNNLSNPSCECWWTSDPEAIRRIGQDAIYARLNYSKTPAELIAMRKSWQRVEAARSHGRAKGHVPKDVSEVGFNSWFSGDGS